MSAEWHDGAGIQALMYQRQTGRRSSPAGARLPIYDVSVCFYFADLEEIASVEHMLVPPVDRVCPRIDQLWVRVIGDDANAWTKARE